MPDLSGTELSLISVRGADLNNPGLINDLSRQFELFTLISLDGVCLARVGDDVCDPGNNNLGCDYDGGDCCLPQAEARDCIDPCGVRLKFYGGQNSGFDACWSDKH